MSAPIPVGKDPVDVVITPDGSKAYVTMAGIGTVSVIDTATGAVSAMIPASRDRYTGRDHSRRQGRLRRDVAQQHPLTGDRGGDLNRVRGDDGLDPGQCRV